MRRKSVVSHPRLTTRGMRTASQALGRLEREHVALLLAICELEAPVARTVDTMTSAAAMTSTPEMRQALLALLRDDLRRTQHALGRAAHGEYGTCEECHHPLTGRHLALKPAATHCAACEAHARRMVRR
ncbi:MAG: hypothetical protein IVW57_15410 [Ktedonobacterales bacterium]|nr:hypothetical protein [Ktedonobacterales bacterium]